MIPHDRVSMLVLQPQVVQLVFASADFSRVPPLAHSAYRASAAGITSGDDAALPGERERRRAIRVRPSLRVEGLASTVGALVDLTEFGALVELPVPLEVNSRLSFDLLWEGSTIRLHGRVVRSTPHYDHDSRLTWREPTSYHVAVEFFDTATQSVIALHRAMQALRDAPEQLPGESLAKSRTTR